MSKKYAYSYKPPVTDPGNEPDDWPDDWPWPPVGPLPPNWTKNDLPKNPKNPNNPKPTHPAPPETPTPVSNCCRGETTYRAAVDTDETEESAATTDFITQFGTWWEEELGGTIQTQDGYTFYMLACNAWKGGNAPTKCNCDDYGCLYLATFTLAPGPGGAGWIGTAKLTLSNDLCDCKPAPPDPPLPPAPPDPPLPPAPPNTACCLGQIVYSAAVNGAVTDDPPSDVRQMFRDQAAIWWQNQNGIESPSSENVWALRCNHKDGAEATGVCACTEYGCLYELSNNTVQVGKTSAGVWMGQATWYLAEDICDCTPSIPQTIDCRDCDPPLCAQYTLTLEGATGDMAVFNGSHTVTLEKTGAPTYTCCANYLVSGSGLSDPNRKQIAFYYDSIPFSGQNNWFANLWNYVGGSVIASAVFTRAGECTPTGSYSLKYCKIEGTCGSLSVAKGPNCEGTQSARPNIYVSQSTTLDDPYYSPLNVMSGTLAWDAKAQKWKGTVSGFWVNLSYSFDAEVYWDYWAGKWRLWIWDDFWGGSGSAPYPVDANIARNEDGKVFHVVVQAIE